MKFGHVLLAYFLVGSLMWAGGVLDYQDSGVSTLIVEPTANGTAVNDDTQQAVEDTGGPIQQAAQSVGASGLFAIWNLVAQFLGFLFWPVTALQSVDAPQEAVVLAGGGMVMALIAGFLLFVRAGA